MNIYKTTEQEIHHFGDYVGVVWNLVYKDKKLLDVDTGETHTVRVTVKDDEPYILFVSVNKYNDSYYSDEDSPVDGGFGIEQANNIIVELQQAIEYMRNL